MFDPRRDTPDREVSGRQGHQEPAAGRPAASAGGTFSTRTSPRCASTIPLTMASPSPAPPSVGAGLGGPGGRTSPGDVEDPLHVVLGDPAALVGDAELDAVRRPPGPGSRPTPSAGVCRIALMIRLVITRDSPTASATTSTPSSTRPPRRTDRARATGSAPAIASLTRSCSGDRLGRHGQDAGVDPGQLEEVVDHPHHPVDLGADLAVVARRVVDHAVLERLGHRPHPGQRRAQVVGDPRDQLAPGRLEPRLAHPRLLQPLAGAGQLLRERLELARAAPPGDVRAVRVEPPRVLAQRLGPAARSPRPTASATTQRDHAGRRHHERDDVAVVRRR